MEKAKRIRYKHVTALRDLGGSFNGGDLRVKKGLIYRSSYLGKMSLPESDEFVDRFKVNTVIDLRTEDEVSLKDDIKSEKVNYVHIPVLRNEDNPAVTKETGNSILKNIVKKMGGAGIYLSSKYRMMVSDEYSLSNFRKIFDLLLEGNPSYVYHCTQGKDRTGVCSALILMALGADKESIIKDYKRYNKPYVFKNNTIRVVAWFRFFSAKMSFSLYQLLSARTRFINAMFDEIETKYQDTKNFLQTALGLSDEKILKLKELYLEN